MPKEITELKKFLELVKENEKDDASSNKMILTIKYGKKITKLKLRKSRYLYTWKTGEWDKAKQVISAVPKTLEKIEIKKRQKMRKR